MRCAGTLLLRHLLCEAAFKTHATTRALLERGELLPPRAVPELPQDLMRADGAAARAVRSLAAAVGAAEHFEPPPRAGEPAAEEGKEEAAVREEKEEGEEEGGAAVRDDEIRVEKDEEEAGAAGGGAAMGAAPPSGGPRYQSALLEGWLQKRHVKAGGDWRGRGFSARFVFVNDTKGRVHISKSKAEARAPPSRAHTAPSSPCGGRCSRCSQCTAVS